MSEPLQEPRISGITFDITDSQIGIEDLTDFPPSYTSGTGPCPKRLVCHTVQHTSPWNLFLASSIRHVEGTSPSQKHRSLKKIAKDAAPSYWTKLFSSIREKRQDMQFHHERVATSSKDKAQHGMVNFSFSSVVLYAIRNYCNERFLGSNQVKAQNVCQSASPFTGTPANQPGIGDTQNCQVMNGAQAHTVKW